MDMENLNQALPESNSIIPLSSDEFQNMLSTWFEEKGIMSDLRSQVRFKMINVLKNTAIGRDISRKSTTSASLSKQIINSIVAEHLMHNKYQYTMSIFNTEASITNIFPNVCKSTVMDENENKSLDRENILNVLEIIGVSKGSRVCEEVLKMYTSEIYRKSLLECLICWLSNVASCTRVESVEEILKSVDTSNEPNIVKELANFLIEYDFTLQSFKKIINKVKILYVTDIEGTEKRFLSEIDSLKEKMHFQENKIKSMHKEKKVTENKLLKISKDYNILKFHLNKLLTEKTISQQQNNLENDANAKKSTDDKNNLNICHLPHCTEICKKNISNIESLLNENYELKKQNCYQKEEIALLTKKYNELLQSLTDCQIKINLLNSRINDGNTTKLLSTLILQENLEIPEVKIEKKPEASEDSSDSITDAILRETRLRLKTLEEESRDVEERCLSYSIK